MPEPEGKREVDTLDGTPHKRLFWSIISDYNLQTALCELVDNAFDMWNSGGESRELEIDISIDVARQMITVSDNAGGVEFSNLGSLVSPGGTNSDPMAATIGIFGVGSKRAVVALAERTTIKTRRGKQQTYEVEITKDWLETETWAVPAYEVPNIGKNSTIVEMSQLRFVLTDDDVDRVRQHFGEVYARFMRKRSSKITLNGEAIVPIRFDGWAYPPGYPPRQVEVEVAVEDELVHATVTGGLVRDRDPDLENYGVYVYCNNRLVVKELREREVGYFVKSEAGVPHPDASLCRVVLELNGPARYMPWNSSKSGVNASHSVFQTVHPTLIQLVTHFSSLSRRLKTTWNEDVFAFAKGKIKREVLKADAAGGKLRLPELPKVRKAAPERLKAANKKVLDAEPWTLGLVESVAFVDMVRKQKLQTRNRIALILLDSNFEIALKEFIVHREDKFPKKQYTDEEIRKIFNNRSVVIDRVRQKVPIAEKLVKRVRHYYNLRNKLIHERTTVDVADQDIANYRDAISKILKKLFKLKMDY